ncbi:MAG: orotate phosphoribosyltransferase [Eubacteriales bacterium]|nr:orotate phosphoribosyltransferase [Eubacteriales bacterium]
MVLKPKNKKTSQEGNNTQEQLIQWLFETGAVKVCDEGRPFWYTSGTIGPYYINTHYLYGGEEKAGYLLDVIDNALRMKREDITDILLKEELKNMRESAVYSKLAEMLALKASEIIPGGEGAAAISGGERRDWFFSVITAHILDIPHISIFKDGTPVVYYHGKTVQAKAAGIDTMRILHIADLVTEASSYIKTWLPSIAKHGGSIKRTLVVVDRLQGGREALECEDVELFSMVRINREFFRKAAELGAIPESSLDFIMSYIDDPHGSMAGFLKNNPDFLKSSLGGDERTAGRARLCLENRIYGDLF